MTIHCYICDYVFTNVNEYKAVGDKVRCKKLCSEENLYVKRKKLQNKLHREQENAKQLEYKNRIDKQHIERNRLNSIKQCLCCLEYIEELNNLYKCSHITVDNKHKVCRWCLDGYLKSQFKDGVYTPSCMFNPSDGCGGIYDTRQIDEVLSYEQAEIFRKMVNSRPHLFNQSNRYKTCPFCCSYSIDTINTPNQRIYRCEKCIKEWCSYCNKPAHSDECYILMDSNMIYDINTNTASDMWSIIEAKLIAIINTIMVDNCPYCGYTYLKDGGCYLMNCNYCGTRFCHLCNSIIYIKQNTFYHHFKGHSLNDGTSNCILFDDVEHYDTISHKIEHNINAIMDDIMETNQHIITLVYYIFKYNVFFSNNVFKKKIDEFKRFYCIKSEKYITHNHNKYIMAYDYLKTNNKLNTGGFIDRLINIMT